MPRLVRQFRLRFGGQQRAQHVYRREQQSDNLLVERHLPRPQPVEQILEPVRKPGQSLKAHRTGAALDGVRRTEHRVQDLRVIRGRAQRQQAGLHGRDLLHALLQKRLSKLGQVDFHSITAILSRG